jgi:hypothetical protein
LILIYTENTSVRLEYVCKFMFNSVLGIDFRITNNSDEYNNYKFPKINYSNSSLNNGIFIKSTNLLFETEITKPNIFVSIWDNKKIFFQTDEKSEIPFDMFAAVFFLISRYEEYLPFKGDEHGRFEANQSLAYKNNFLQEPIVDKWIFSLAEIIEKRYSNFNIVKRKFKYISTIDVDNAYAYLYKGNIRTIGATFRSLIDFDFPQILERYSAIIMKDDPYDTYDYFEHIHKKFKIDPIWFFLLANYGKYDRNVPARKQAFQLLIKNMADKYQLGIHPSYKSIDTSRKFKNEISRLRKITNKEITKSRQHFLRISFPDTYRNLIKNGIKEDYTLGYASDIGFRAGTCTPFMFYDLSKEEETELKIFPFQIMDATLNKYLKLSENEAISNIEKIVNKVKEVNGTFISLWHNESLSNQGHWKGWDSVYKEMLRCIYDD